VLGQGRLDPTGDEVAAGGVVAVVDDSDPAAAGRWACGGAGVKTAVSGHAA
jgi:hypothetical protein